MISRLSRVLIFCGIIFAILLITGWYFLSGDKAELSVAEVSGPSPAIVPPRREIVPTFKIPPATGWEDGEMPEPAKGLRVVRFAEGLDHPRNMIVLPNGDVLVAETNSQPRQNKGFEGFVMRYLMKRAGAGGKSADRITLLRDVDNDGVAEYKTVLLDGLYSPYGMALVGDTLYVANTNALMAYPFKPGQTKITDKGRKLTDLNDSSPNNHWTRNLLASPDGKTLYIAVGSASNIAENGLKKEKERAVILEYEIETGKKRIFASGLRNPVGMAWEPNSGDLWAVVNERDMLGSDLVPDYLTRVSFGSFYGWPWNYWGGYEDFRVQPGRPDLRQYTHRPEYALGSHTAPLGLSFADGAALGSDYSNGAFIALHGSWNRKPVAGYKVVFVPFGEHGRPDVKRDKDGKVLSGLPVDVLNGFLSDGGKARGRPTDVRLDKRGGLLVSDDVGGIIWRVDKPGAKPAPRKAKPAADDDTETAG